MGFVSSDGAAGADSAALAACAFDDEHGLYGVGVCSGPDRWTGSRFTGGSSRCWAYRSKRCHYRLGVFRRRCGSSGAGLEENALDGINAVLQDAQNKAAVRQRRAVQTGASHGDERCG